MFLRLRLRRRVAGMAWMSCFLGQQSAAAAPAVDSAGDVAFAALIDAGSPAVM